MHTNIISSMGYYGIIVDWHPGWIALIKNIRNGGQWVGYPGPPGSFLRLFHRLCELN